MKFASAEQGAKADTALQQSDVASTYSASGTAPVNGTAVSDAIGTLNVLSVGGSGKYVSAIYETGGKINATPITFDTALSSSSTNNNAPTSKAVYDDQQRQETEIGAVANRGAKNLLWNHEAGYSETIHGRKFTVLSDGGIKIEGAASDSTNADFYIIGSWSNRNVLLNESNEQLAMRLSCTSDYGYNEIRLRVLDRSTGSTVVDSGIEVNKDRTFSHIVTTVFITIWPTVTLPTNGIIVYPMIRPASITDSTFQPYALPNTTLTPAVIKAVDEGAKNRFDISATPTVYHTSYTVSGNTVSVASSGNYARLSFPCVFKSGKSRFRCTVSNRAVAGGTMQIRFSQNADTSGSLSDPITITQNGEVYSEISVSDDTNGFITFYLNTSGTSYENSATFNEIMLCTAADYAVSPKFVPYAPTNRELYETCETKVTMQQVYGDAIPIPAESNLNDYKTPGLYYALVANVPTITNTPYNATGFRLVVEKNTPSGAAVFQTIYPTSRTHLEFYRRVYEGGSWSSWYKFEGTAVT